MPADSGQSNTPRRGRPLRTEPGVEWEMVTRWPWDDKTAIEIRAVSTKEIEITVTARNGYGAATRMVSIADVRQALDELERSAQVIEKL